MSTGEHWSFEGHVSGRHLIGSPGDWRTDFYIQRIFDAFDGQRVRVTVEVLDTTVTVRKGKR